MNSWCESCARKNLCYVVNDRPKCFVPITNTASGTSESYLAKSLRYSRDSHEIAKDEPRTDCGDFADRLAYERGVKHAWEVAQKVFNSTVTFFAAEDVAKQIDKDINVRSKTEPQTDIHDFTDCDFCKDKNCKDCEGGKDEPQTDTDLILEWSCSFSDCDNFENFGVNERCVKCKQMQRKATKPQTMPIKKKVTGSKGERIEYTEAEMVVRDEPQTERDGNDFQNDISASHMLRTMEDSNEQPLKGSKRLVKGSDPCDGCIYDSDENVLACVACVLKDKQNGKE